LEKEEKIAFPVYNLGATSGCAPNGWNAGRANGMPQFSAFVPFHFPGAHIFLKIF